jgi:hypothetical protein
MQVCGGMECGNAIMQGIVSPFFSSSDEGRKGKKEGKKRWVRLVTET